MLAAQRARQLKCPLLAFLLRSLALQAILEHPAFASPASDRAPIGESVGQQQAQGISKLL